MPPTPVYLRSNMARWASGTPSIVFPSRDFYAMAVPTRVSTAENSSMRKVTFATLAEIINRIKG